MKLSLRAMAVLAAVVSFGLANTAQAEDYTPMHSDHPFRIAAYPVHAVGKGLEYLVTRPTHWFVSQPKTRHIFGKVSNPKREDYFGDKDQYQRLSY